MSCFGDRLLCARPSLTLISHSRQNDTSATRDAGDSDCLRLMARLPTASSDYLSFRILEGTVIIIMPDEDNDMVIHTTPQHMPVPRHMSSPLSTRATNSRLWLSPKENKNPGRS